LRIVTIRKKRMVDDSGQFRLTRQRRVILEVVEAREDHPTADEVYEAVRRRLPGISLGTVYRNLEAMSEAGLVRKLEFAGCRKRFDKTLSEHHHIRCISCRRVEDISIKPARDLMKGCTIKTDFRILGYKVEFIGICPECQKKEKRGSRGRAKKV
jgi:Fur family ferric uptake transcriptional regulator